MKILYSNGLPLSEFTPNSLFLAGPTPRSVLVESWRPKAIQILTEIISKDLTICVPEPQLGWFQVNYLNQIEWELTCLANAEKIIFWVPRNLENMHGLTTNVEFGYWIAKTPEKVYYGRPDDASSCGYLDYLYNLVTKRIPHNNLEDLLKEVI